MDDGDLLDIACNPLDVALELILVGVAGKSVDGGDLGTHGRRFTEYVHGVFAGAKLATQGVFRAEADEQDQVAFVAEVVLEMMTDAPGFRHARGADDDGGI